ncbi:MAG: HDOD domain-containing protein, partial [Planctomycetota bacterium]
MKLDTHIIDGTLMCLPPCSFRPALRKVQAIARDERCSNTVLSAIIGNDPGMALLVLSRANFAHDSDEGFLGISSAINRLGLGGTAALLDEITVIPEHLIRPLGANWASASAAVTMSRLLLYRVNGALFPSPHDRDIVAACAVLFDLGTILAIRGFGEQCTLAGQRLAADEDSFPSLLGEELGMSPGELAKRHVSHWGLPASIAEALAQQYQPIPEGRDPL